MNWGIVILVFSLAFVLFMCGLVFYKFFHIENWREKMEMGTFEGEEAETAKLAAYAAGLIAFMIGVVAFVALVRAWN